MFGLLDDIDRQDVKDFLNSAVDNTADLYNTVTEYDYENMFDDIGDYFRGLLSDEPASPMSSKMGAAFGSRGRGRPAPSVTVERVTTNRPKLMGVLESANKMGPTVRAGMQDMPKTNYQRDFPEYVSLRDLDPPSTAAMNRLMRSEYPFNRPQMMEDVPLMKRISPERRQLAAFASRNPGGMRNAPDYGSEMAKVRPAREYRLISPEAGDRLAAEAEQMANKYFDRLRGY